ncbi:MAG: pyruvate, phosphate dikinase [Acidobacteria bacterium]|nr:pyruvate, phosphate dikinase [Acidobacteriota bacterium]
MAPSLAQRVTDAVHGAEALQSPFAVAAALNSVNTSELAAFFHVSLASEVDAEPLTTGLPASPGTASGRLVLSADDAMAATDAGEAVILVRQQTTPDDVLGMQASAGIVTSRGGLLSHAAVVARGWGIPAVVGAADVSIQGDNITIGDNVCSPGDVVTIDGATGNIYAGNLAVSSQQAPSELDILLAWADAVAAGQVEVRANADTVGDATIGRSMGAQGIGLCRTEHMFLAADRLPIMRRFILSDSPDTDVDALKELEVAQTADFEMLLTAMDGLPVTIRLLDPPLHEFLPDLVDLSVQEAKGELDAAGLGVLAAVRRLHEVNPMIGTRGVRLGVMRSGLYQMQVRALCTAAVKLFERGLKPLVELMIPLVVDAEELRLARGWVTDVLDEIGHPELASNVVTIGAMIETPRAAITAAALADHADFFSFGTNDLTQLTYAFSRDDVETRLLPAYQAQGILSVNPFAVLDQDGVGALLRIACEAARSRKPDIKLGVCGEHAGDPESVDFLVRAGVDSVSCSPFRVPLARLAVAQALLACGRVHIGDITFEFGPEGSAEVDGNSDSVRSADSKTEPADGEVVEIDEALVLHILRVRGFVTTDGFIDSLGAHPEAILLSLHDAGHVRHIEARDMYALMPTGRERHESLLDTYATENVRARLTTLYDRFLALNETFKQLCTDWQLRDGDPNDHTDVEYDQNCIAELVEVAAAIDPVIESLSAVLPRLTRYRDRLRAAAEQVASGNTKLFTGVACNSFHDIWMELHEDLIVLQRIDRSKEGSF